MQIENKIKYRTLAVFISIVLSFGAFVLYKINYCLDDKLNESLDYKNSLETKLFNKIVSQHSKKYAKWIDILLKDDAVTEAFSLRQRDLLYEKTIDTFKEFQKDNSFVKIFTFRLPDGSAFLRVHKPKMFGDALNKKRKIITDTNIEKKRNYGFEVGKLKMTYRIVTPIFKDGNYIGSVEFGIEPEVFMKVMSAVVNLNYALVVRKGMQDVMLKQKVAIIKDDYLLFSEDEFFKKVFKIISVKDRIFINFKDKKFAVDTNLFLKDHKGNIQAFFLTSDDITDKVASSNSLKQTLTLLILFTIIITILILNYSINYYIKSIKKMFYTDELTQLANRNALIDKIKNTTSTSNMLLIDINSFKTINELYGVSSGNNILMQMGEIIKKIALYHNMQAYRISSDEFILFSYTSEKILDVNMLQDIYIAIKEQSFSLSDLDVLVDIDITIGGVSGETISLEKVDMALKSARNEHLEYVLYSEKINTKKDTTKVVQVRKDIKYALENNNIVPYFQPIVDKEGNIIKYEALMRMIKLDSGKQEVISPFYFLDFSFKFNLYIKLSKAMIMQSFEVLKKTDKCISINLAPSDILDNTMSKYILNKLKACSKPQQIVVEITENEDIKDFEIVKKFIFEVKEIGAKLAIDDFGSGYANYSNIFELKPDYIKIDGSLIKDITTNKESQIFVKNIISLSKELGVKTIAEFVHSKEVFELVKSYGVDEFQGYYFGAPTAEID
ncbi:MAG: EAL domain-containing protein [Sulfurimonas sp.]|nr:EAL domain-containing protein [Sulfurimonas sp.]